MISDNRKCRVRFIDAVLLLVETLILQLFCCSCASRRPFSRNSGNLLAAGALPLDWMPYPARVCRRKSAEAAVNWPRLRSDVATSIASAS